MSSLNSTSENSSLIQVLVEGRKLSWDQIHDAKVDVAHLERKFELVKPRLKYLGMYKSLAEHLATPLDYALRTCLDQTPELAEQDCIRLRGLGWKYGQTTPFTLQFERVGYRTRGRVYLFITRRGQWIVMIQHPSICRILPASYDSVSELCSTLESLSSGQAWYLPPGPEDYTEDFDYTFPFQISLALDSLVEGRVSERRKQLKSMEELQEGMRKLNDRMIGER